MITKRDQLRTDLHRVLMLVGTLLIIGLLFVYSASSVYSLAVFKDSHYFFKKQIYGIIVGIVAFFCTAQFCPVSFIKKYALLFLWITIGITSLTLIPSLAIHIHGSHRWISLFRFSFQPSELLKISVVIFCASVFACRPKMISRKKVIHFVGALTLIISILLKQPDFGLTLMLSMISLFIYFIAQGNRQFFCGIIAVLIPFAGFFTFHKSYRIRRVMTFLNPWEDAKGKGFQIIQSLIAIGSGGIWGTGITHSKQKLFYLPMQHTDFIFSIIAEETGLIGAFALITLFTLLFYYMVRVAFQLTDFFSQLITIGFALIIYLQAMINIAVCTGLVPTKGIGLPFISYGNSGLVCNMMMIGTIVSLVRENRSSF